MCRRSVMRPPAAYHISASKRRSPSSPPLWRRAYSFARPAFKWLCVYRGTPLWQEYVKRGLVSETTDWYKYFKCSTIDPTCLPGEVINEVRRQGLKRLFVYKLLHYPLQTFRLLRRFLRFMPARDVAYLIIKPFLGQKKGATKAEVLSRAVEHADMKDAAAQMTQMTDDMLHSVMEESRL